MKPRLRPEWLAACLLSALLSGCPQLASDEFNKAEDSARSDDGSTLDSGGTGGTGGQGGTGGSGGTGGQGGTGGIPLSTVSIASINSSATTETGESTSQGGSLIGTGTDSGTDTTDGGTETSSSTGGTECMEEVEVCDGLDNDCDGNPDQDETCGELCSGFVLYEHRYVFCGTLASVTDAARICSEHGLSLVQIDSADENDALVDEVSPLFDELTEPSIEPAFWTDASDEKSQGNWIWTGSGSAFWEGLGNGEPVGDAYNNWDSGKPNEANAYPEDCAVVYLPGASDGAVGTWNDLPCREKYAFVCEAEY